VSSIEEALILGHLRTLKLPAIRAEYAAVARHAHKDGWSYEAYLQELLEVEMRSREHHMSSKRLKEARFPEIKTLEQIDWNVMQGVSRQKVAQLATCQFIEKAEDVLIGGPIGTGSFVKAAELVRVLLEARDDRMLGQLQARLRRVTLLVIDELGFVPFDRAGGELLFNLIADRYERRSTIVTTNLAFSEWVQVFVDEKLTTALLDRLGHHAHVLTTKGASYRTQKRKAKVEP
jgi:DNA replication protein DnaC